MKKELAYAKALKIAKTIARRKEGGLIVLGPKNKFRGKYELLYPQLIKGHNLNRKGIETVIEKLTTLDGAVLFSDRGELLSYGAKIKRTKIIRGYGTKNAAAAGITRDIPESTAFLIPEKTDWIRVFREGTCILEMDSSETPANFMKKIVNLITDRDTALITAAGASAALVGIGPAVVVGGAYLIIRTASGIIKKSIK